MSVAPRLISVDWGTTSFRAYLVSGKGDVLDRVENDRGILAARDAGFERILASSIAPLLSGARLPVLMSGMIGSRQGWVEAPYLACPAGLAELASRLLRAEIEMPVHIVPGLLQDDVGQSPMPDVMRGEETQVLGAISAAAGNSDTLVLPGTHSKWVEVENGRIVRFATFMTGEIFAALKDHTILGRLMEAGPADGDGFLSGVVDGAGLDGPPGRLLNAVFGARTLALTGRLAPAEVAGYLSGLLIGAELAAASGSGRQAFTVIAGPTLTGLYRTAAACLGLTAHAAPADCIVAGHLAIADAAGL